jgi:hypothetical protein
MRETNVTAAMIHAPHQTGRVREIGIGTNWCDEACAYIGASSFIIMVQTERMPDLMCQHMYSIRYLILDE